MVKRSRSASASSRRRRRIGGGYRSKKKGYGAKRRRRLAKRSRKQIKNVVKRVLQCGENVGLYTKDYLHQYSPIVGAADLQVVFDAGQVNDANASGTGGNNKLADPTNEALKFSPFSGRKMLDAVSVLYNGKPKGLNFAATDATPPSIIDPSTRNFEMKDLKVDFLYCSYELNMINNSQTVYDVELYFGRPKMDMNDSLQGRWNSNKDNVAWLSGAPEITHINNTPGVIPALKGEYDFRKVMFRFQPGDSKRFFTKFKGCVDFAKHLRGNGELQNYMKGVTQSWMFIVKPVVSSHVDAGSTEVEITRATMDNVKPDTWLFETKEVYKMMEPDGTVDDYQGNHREYFTYYPKGIEGGTYRQMTFTVPHTSYFSAQP